MPENQIQPRIARPHAALALVTPAGVHRTVSLARTVMLLGSGSAVQVRLQTRTIDAFHALLLNVDDSVRIYDLGSANGIEVNGQRVKGAPLEDGDRLTLGKVTFTFSEGSPKDEPQDASLAQPAPRLLREGANLHEISGAVSLIGRSAGCDVRLEGEEVAEKHALIFAAANANFILRMDPSAPVYVNGAPVRQCPLVPGDVIRIGQTELIFEENERTAVTTEAHVEAADPQSIGAATSEPIAEPVAASIAPSEIVQCTEHDDRSEGHRAVGPIASVASAPKSAAQSAQLQDVSAWGPLALAMVLSQHPQVEPQDNDASEAEDPTPTRKRWWPAGTAVFVTLLAAAGWLLYKHVH